MKMVLIRRKRLSILAGVLITGLMIGVVNHPALVGATATSRQLPIYCVQRDQKLASLTFDAAWGNEDTENLIQILGEYSVRATFFVVGDWVENIRNRSRRSPTRVMRS